MISLVNLQLLLSGSKVNLLVGSTGFLGNHILKELSINKSPTTALARRVIPNRPENTHELIIDFNNLSEIKISHMDHVYLSLGYPLYFHNVIGYMGSKLKKNFFQVDFTYQLEIAKKFKEAGTKNISLISAAGANPNSWNYYLKVKGMLEMEIIKLGFDSTNIFQPGHLRGNKLRFDIVFADIVSIIIDPFLHGPIKKLRSISATKLAKSVVNNSSDRKAGVNYFDFKDFT